MKLSLFFLIFSFSIGRFFATGQEPDKIIIENKVYSLLNNPLEQFFERNPEFHPIYGSKIKKTNKYKDVQVNSTGNYRGYIATFKIENSYLQLVDIQIMNIESENSDYISVYKDLCGDKQIKIDYNGILVIPTGDLLSSDHFGYSYLFSNYKLVTIKNDQVKKSKNLTKDEFIKFKHTQFNEYKKSDNYKNEIKQYYEMWEFNKEIDLSKKFTKNLSRKEISELKKEYSQPPKIEIVENFIFLMENFDYIIVDY